MKLAPNGAGSFGGPLLSVLKVAEALIVKALENQNIFEPSGNLKLGAVRADDMRDFIGQDRSVLGHFDCDSEQLLHVRKGKLSFSEIEDDVL
jgi:hypothetical protein